MIITRLRGGLGNQLFQYACGRALSIRTKNPMKLDVSGYEKTNQENNHTDTKREYSLSYFSIQENIATSDEIRRLKYPFGIFSKGWRFIKVKILRQFNTGFIPSALHWTGNIYLDGYWQTELYFKDTAETIRKELTLKNQMTPTAQAFMEQIKNAGESSVSLHVRRGDVARDAATNPYFGVCTPDYYKKTIEKINEFNKIIPAPQIFVFTDDPQWVRQNIAIPKTATFISGKNIPDYEELILMSTCRHHIIANSSFSWWGAWLNANPAKIVIAPKEWITRNKKIHKDTVPPSWIRL